MKIRGNRIEIDEIECALLALDGVREAVVVAREGRSGDQRLVAYVVPVGGRAPTVTELRRALAKTLPEQMIPSAYVVLDALPLAPNGKVNRRELPAPGQSRPDLEVPYVAARTPFEKALADIWSSALAVGPIGIHDNFFDLGGNSLLATRIMSRVLHSFHVEMAMSGLFAKPTIQELALAILEKLAQQAGSKGVHRLCPDAESPPGGTASRMHGIGR